MFLFHIVCFLSIFLQFCRVPRCNASLVPILHMYKENYRAQKERFLKAIQKNDVKTALEVLNKNKDAANAFVNARDKRGISPLHYAVSFENEELIKKLIEYGASIDIQEYNNGQTPLHYAIKKQNHHILKLLLEKNASVSVQDKDGKNALFLALEKENCSFIQMIAQKDRQIVDVADGNKITPLQYAIHLNNPTLVTCLLALDATINSEAIRTCKNQECASIIAKNIDSRKKKLYTAIQGKRDLKKIGKLLDAIPIEEIDTIDLLKKAIIARNIEVVKELCKFIDINAQDKEGDTVLHYAVQNTECRSEIIEELLKFDTNLNIQNKKGESPLLIAAHRGCSKIIKLLLGYNADPYVADKQEITILHYAAMNNLVEIIQKLSCDGNIKDIDVKDKNNGTPLYYAAKHAQSNAIKELLDLGADINATDTNNMTPLHVLMSIDRPKEQEEWQKFMNSLDSLLKSPNIDLEIKDKDGELVTGMNYIKRHFGVTKGAAIYQKIEEFKKSRQSQKKSFWRFFNR